MDPTPYLALSASLQRRRCVSANMGADDGIGSASLPITDSAIACSIPGSPVCMRMVRQPDWVSMGKRCI